MATHKSSLEKYATLAEIKRILGLQSLNLDQRDVERTYDGHKKQYVVADVWRKCGDLISKKNLGVRAESFEDADDLKTEKLAEEVRKLRIANNEAEGLLVRSDEVRIAYDRAFKAMADELDSMVSRVKVACPDIPQSALAAISDQLTTARNRAADIDFGALLDG